MVSGHTVSFRTRLFQTCVTIGTSAYAALWYDPAMHGNYYRLSGKFTPIGLVTALGVGLGGTAVASWLYGYVMAWIPLVYIMVLGVIGYGIGGGALVSLGLNLGKIRNRMVALAVGLVVSVFAVYAGWVTWLFAMTSQELFIWAPGPLFHGIVALGQEGVLEHQGQHSQRLVALQFLDR